MKNNIPRIEEVLKKKKCVALVAPSFVAEFSYPSVLNQLKKLGFDKSVELTFGAKMINRDYHKILESTNKLLISSVCPGIVEMIKEKFPEYKENIIPVDSPMVATGKICRKFFPKHKLIFISPCNYKKIEAENSEYIDYVMDYSQLKELFKKYKIGKIEKDILFDKFYNDYTKIYPLAGGLGKTVHLKGILKKDEIETIDGIGKVMKWLEKPNKKIKFLDVNFCVGGCIGGPCTDQNLTIEQKKKRVLSYAKNSKKEDIPDSKKGVIKKAEGISFLKAQ